MAKITKDVASNKKFELVTDDSFARSRLQSYYSLLQKAGA